MAEVRPLARALRSAWTLVAIAVLALCTARAAALVAQHGVDLVLMDQFDFFAPLFDALEGRDWSLLRKLRFQFEGSAHRMGLGWPLIELVAHASGWSSRADGFAIAGVLACAAALALALDARLSGRLDAASLALPLLILTHKQYATFIGTTDVALGALPVALVIALALASTLRDVRARVAAWLALDLACVYTGFALFAGALVPLLVAREAWLGRIGARAALGAIALAVAIGLSFFVGLDGAPLTSASSAAPGFAGVLAYATGLFASFWAVDGGPLALVVAIAWPIALGAPLALALLRTLRREGAAGADVDAVVIVLSGFGALFVAANAIGRSGESGDVSHAFAPRYVTLMIPGALGLYFALRHYLRGRTRGAVLALFAAAVVASEVAASERDRESIEWLASSKRAWAECYVEARSVAACNERARFEVYPWREEYPRIERQLALLEARGLSFFAGAPARARSEEAIALRGAPPRHVLLISVDTLRADHLGLYGYARPTSPTIDALGAQGLVFERASSTAPWTLPSHTSLLTGLAPHEHGVQDDGVRLADDVPTLAAALAARGVATIGVVSHLYVASPFGLARGFGVFDDSLIEGGTTNPSADAVVARFLEHLDRHLAKGGPPEAPFFGFVHFFDPHWDYRAPEPFTRRFVDPRYAGPMDGTYAAMNPYLLDAKKLAPADRDALIAYYDGEIAYLDAQIAKLLNALRDREVLADTLVVLTGDHGEEFGEHGRLGHGRSVFEEQLHVPLVLAHASLPALRVADPVSLVDVAPTLLEMLGGERESLGSGRSLLGPHDPGRALVAESIRYGLEWRAARRGAHKLVELAGGEQRWFFDLARDPAERRPAPRDPSAGGELARDFERFRSESDRGFQLKLVAGDGERLRYRARIEAQGGRLRGARHYASAHIAGRDVRFERFDLAADGASLEVDVAVDQHTGAIRFDVDPADASVRIETRELSLTTQRGREELAPRASDGSALARDARIARSDARIAPRLARPGELASGVHVRAGAPGAARMEELSDAARRHLEALGYGEGGVDSTEAGAGARE